MGTQPWHLHLDHLCPRPRPPAVRPPLVTSCSLRRAGPGGAGSSAIVLLPPLPSLAPTLNKGFLDLSSQAFKKRLKIHPRSGNRSLIKSAVISALFVLIIRLKYGHYPEGWGGGSTLGQMFADHFFMELYLWAKCKKGGGVNALPKDLDLFKVFILLNFI